MKKKSLLLIIGIPLLAYVIGQAAGKKLGENMSGGSNSSTPVETSVEDDTQKEDNPEYTKIFTERSIIKPSMLVLGKDSASYAKVGVTDEGLETIDCIDIAYDADTGIISNLTDVGYIDVSSFTQEELESVETEIQEAFQGYEGENFSATFEGETLNSYYKFCLEYKNLEDEDVVKNFVDQGLLTTTGTGTGALSFTVTENSLLSQGYIKK